MLSNCVCWMSLVPDPWCACGRVAYAQTRREEPQPLAIFVRFRCWNVVRYYSISQHDETCAMCERKVEIVRHSDAEFACLRFFPQYGEAMKLLFDVEKS